MKVLFAAPDRDLLECFGKLLSDGAAETVTAFDGAQALSLLGGEAFDAVILDRDLPRVGIGTLIGAARQRGFPVVLLTDEPVRARQLTEDPLPNAYLAYPFTSERLKCVLTDTAEKAKSRDRISIGALTVDVGGFRIENGPPVTAGEIDTLAALADGRPVRTDDGAYISALNDKFARMGSKTRIRYRTKEGFKTVTDDE